MNTTSRNLLILFLLIIWGLYTVVVYRGCYDTLCTSCAEGNASVLPADTINPYDLAFKWSSAQPYINEGFSEIRQLLKEQTSETKILEIKAKYFPEEEQPEASNDLGMARAEQVKNNFFADLPEYMVRVSSTVAEQVPDNAKTGFFEATEFSFIEPKNNLALGFLWSNPKPVAGPGIDALVDSIQNEGADNKILEIIGLYFDSEKTPEGSENIGLQRAELIRSQFFAELPDDRVRLRARANTDQQFARYNYFKGVAYEWVTAKETVTETVEELADRIIIRFPFNSVEKEYDPEVDGYLQKLAERVKQSEEEITITGHADNKGTDQYNMQLGMERAVQIKQILIDGGVAPGQISISSKGETQPVASNATKEGRYENRRVEVRLIKKDVSN